MFTWVMFTRAQGIFVEQLPEAPKELCLVGTEQLLLSSHEKKGFSLQNKGSNIFMQHFLPHPSPLWRQTHCALHPCESVPSPPRPVERKHHGITELQNYLGWEDLLIPTSLPGEENPSGNPTSTRNSWMITESRIVVFANFLVCRAETEVLK